MKKKFSKILGVGLTLALLVSLLLTAAPVSALTQPSAVPSSTTISATTSYAVTFITGKELGTAFSFQVQDKTSPAVGTATWALDGTEDVAHLSTGDPLTLMQVDYAAVVVPYDADLSTITELGYSYKIVDGRPANDSAPYLVLALDTNASGTADTWLVHNLFVGPALNTWDTWKLSVEGKTMTAGKANLMWHDQSTDYADWTAVKAVYDSDTVLDVKVAVGEWDSDHLESHYVDNIIINTTTYDLDPETITITFPVGTIVPATITGATIQASPGWIRGGWANATTTGITFAGVASTRTVTATLDELVVNDQIGEGATVRIEVPGITNPPTIGSYSLTVKTSKETTAVTSTVYTLIGPTIIPLPGVVERRNSAGVLMEQTNTIQTAIDNASAGDVISVGAGTYDEDLVIALAITVTGDAATTIIKDANASGTGGTVTLSAKSTFDGFTVVGRTFGVKVDTAAGTTVKNSVLSGATAGALDIDVGSSTLPTISTGNTITVATADHGINVAVGTVAKSTDDTFTVAGTGKGIINNGTLTLTGANISGASGIGFESLNVAAISTITGTTFSGLDTAILVTNGATVAVSSSTITGSGRAAVTGPPVVTAMPAIDVAAVATSVTFIGNTIADSVDEILQVAADSEKVFLNFNTITNPAKGIDNNDPDAVTLDATNNLWDGGVAPPVTMAPLSATTGMIDTTPYLVAATSNPKIAVAATTLTAKTTAGVNVTTTTAADAIAVATYADNPGTAAVPGVASAYFDVYVSGAVAPVTIMLYGTVTADTKAYVWGAGLGKWVLASPQAVNIFAGSITITVTATSTPTLTDLAGLPLAIADPTPTTVIATAPEIVMPKAGAVDVVLRPTFDWLPVAGADGYYFQLADNPLFAPPLLINFEGDLGRLLAVQTAYTYVPGLDDYATAYHWRVKAVSGTIGAGDLLESAWVENVFITMDEPVEPADVILEPADVILEPADVIVTLPPATPITPSWIYVIIAVGAVLVIALLVLIVRTRRVA